MEAKVYTEMCELFTEYLTERKLRKTEERYTIFKEICDFPGHFDVSALSEKLERNNFHVSKATLYNTLDVLVDAGLVVRHQWNAQPVQYELRIYAETHARASERRVYGERKRNEDFPFYSGVLLPIYIWYM